MHVLIPSINVRDSNNSYMCTSKQYILQVCTYYIVSDEVEHMSSSINLKYHEPVHLADIGRELTRSLNMIFIPLLYLKQ